MGGLKLSIVIRTYNRNRFLKEALSSLSNQNYKNWEVIIFDDGDNIDNFITYSTFKKLHKDNRCVYVTSQTAYELFKDSWEGGVHLSKGDVCIRLDDDDLLLPYTLQYINDIYQKNTKLDFTYGSSLIFNELNEISDSVISKTPFETTSTGRWMPYNVPNNYPYSEHYYWEENYYEPPIKFTSIIHASRANVLCIYHLYTFRINTIKKVIDKFKITSTLCDDLEFYASIDYLSLNHTSIKDILILNRNHSNDRVSDLSKIGEAGLSWKDEVERVRCKVDELRSDGFVSKIIPVELPHYEKIEKSEMSEWIKYVWMESLKF